MAKEAGDDMTDVPPILPGFPLLPPIPPLPAPIDVYAAFAGAIDQTSLQRFFQAFATVMAQPSTGAFHLLFNSNGGTVSEGVALYNYFRALTIDFTIYNAGAVQSAGVVAYLGAKKRKVSAHAAFMVHRTHVSPQYATADRLHAFTNSLRIDDERTEAILRQYLTLSEEQWQAHHAHELWLTAPDAVKAGLANEVGEFSPPPGRQIFGI